MERQISKRSSILSNEVYLPTIKMVKELFTPKQFTGYLQRGQIISQFAYIENLIKVFIICSFFNGREESLAKRLNQEVLDDPNFHFSTLKSVFETILNKYHPELFKQYKSDICGKLRGMYDIRCTVAHSIEMANNIVDGQPTELSESVVKWSKKGHPQDETIKSLFDKFFKHNGNVVLFLESLIKIEESKK